MWDVKERTFLIWERIWGLFFGDTIFKRLYTHVRILHVFACRSKGKRIIERERDREMQREREREKRERKREIAREREYH